eukprot:gene12231-biopygen399
MTCEPRGPQSGMGYLHISDPGSWSAPYRSRASGIRPSGGGHVGHRRPGVRVYFCDPSGTIRGHSQRHAISGWRSGDNVVPHPPQLSACHVSQCSQLGHDTDSTQDVGTAVVKGSGTPGRLRLAGDGERRGWAPADMATLATR